MKKIQKTGGSAALTNNAGMSNPMEMGSAMGGPPLGPMYRRELEVGGLDARGLRSWAGKKLTKWGSKRGAVAGADGYAGAKSEKAVRELELDDEVELIGREFDDAFDPEARAYWDGDLDKLN